MIQIVIAFYSIRSSHDQESPCPSPSQLRLNVRRRSCPPRRLLPTQKMAGTCDQECTMVFGEHFVFYHPRVPLVAMPQKRTDVFLGFYLVPIDVGVSTKNSHLMLAMAAHVRFAHCSIEVSINRWRVSQAECVSPGPLHLLDRNCFAC